MADYDGNDDPNYRSAAQENEDDQSNFYRGFGSDDTLYGGNLADDIEGGEGKDDLRGGDGADTLIGGNGGGYLSGDQGDDQLSFQDGDFTVFGGTGDDVIYCSATSAQSHAFIEADAGDDYFVVVGSGLVTMEGNAGEDTVSYITQTGGGVTVNLMTGQGGGRAAGNTYESIEDVIGTSVNDRLVGDGAYNFLFGYFGADTITGGAGGDRLDGGDGTDTVDYAGSDLGVTVDLKTQTASGGDAQGDRISSFERAQGSSLRDILNGSDGDNQLVGQGGDDSLAGRGGIDALSGGDGNDKLLGGLGADQLRGGAGADKFIFQAGDSTSASRDTILDFSRAQADKIDLSLIDANTGAALDQKFSFIGTAAFHGIAGELRYIVSGGVAYALGDVNGDTVVDVSIAVSGVASFESTDFVL